MLDVPLDELPPGRAKQVLARHLRSCEGQSHAVLQLIAKPIGTTRLIEGRTRPDAAGERLV